MASNNIVIVDVSIETFHRQPVIFFRSVYAGVKPNVFGLLFKYSHLESDKINPFKNNKDNTKNRVEQHCRRVGATLESCVVKELDLLAEKHLGGNTNLLE